MKVRCLALLVLVLVLGFVVSGAPANAVQFDPAKNCVITVFASLKSGSISEREFSIPAKNPQDCRKKAKAHENNFAPQFVKSVRVSTFWRGGSGGGLKKDSYDKRSGRGYRR